MKKEDIEVEVGGIELNNDFLPKDYSIPVSTSFMNFEAGDNKFRALSGVAVGYEYWTKENKPIRSKMYPKDTPNIQTNEDGSPRNVNHVWAFVVWDYKNKKVALLEIAQKGVMKSIESLVHNSDWGNPKGYDITVTKEGSGLKTKYSVIPSNKAPISAEIETKYSESEINPEDLFVTTENNF